MQEHISRDGDQFFIVSNFRGRREKDRPIAHTVRTVQHAGFRAVLLTRDAVISFVQGLVSRNANLSTRARHESSTVALFLAISRAPVQRLRYAAPLDTCSWRHQTTCFSQKMRAVSRKAPRQKQSRPTPETHELGVTNGPLPVVRIAMLACSHSPAPEARHAGLRSLNCL